MDNHQFKKKIKSQKMAALFLIFAPLILTLYFVTKKEFLLNNRNEFIMVGALIVLVIVGSIGLKNSLRKEKELLKL